MRGYKKLSIEDKENILLNSTQDNWKRPNILAIELGLSETAINNYRHQKNLHPPKTVDDEKVKFYSTQDNWLSAEELSLKLGVSNQSICIARSRLKIMLVCPNCKKEFLYSFNKSTKKTNHSVYRDPKFCTYECFKQWMKKSFEKECPICHKMFTGKKYFCSNECKNIEKQRLNIKNDEINEIKRKNKIEENRKICPECGVEFIKSGAQIFCSKSCRIKHYKVENIKAICKNCGKEFLISERKPRKFCSLKCHGDYMSKESAKQGNFEMPTRVFALFVLKLRETNKDVFKNTISAVKEEITGLPLYKHGIKNEEWEKYYWVFNKYLGKMQKSIRGKPYDENKSKIMRQSIELRKQT
jgi:biotin operon repressor/endogenous inhibitor of DNA gyrase (YacG/DUF329 family)